MIIGAVDTDELKDMYTSTSLVKLSNEEESQKQNGDTTDCGFCGCNGFTCIVIGIVLGMALSTALCCFVYQLIKYILFKRSVKDVNMTEIDVNTSQMELETGTPYV